MVRHEDSKKKKKTKGQPFCRSGKLTCRKRPESSKMGMRAEVNTPFWALDSSSCDSRDSIWCLCCWDFLLASWSFLARSVWPEISEERSFRAALCLPKAARDPLSCILRISSSCILREPICSSLLVSSASSWIEKKRRARESQGQTTAGLVLPFFFFWEEE